MDGDRWRIPGFGCCSLPSGIDSISFDSLHRTEDDALVLVSDRLSYPSLPACGGNNIRIHIGTWTGNPQPLSPLHCQRAVLAHSPACPARLSQYDRQTLTPPLMNHLGGRNPLLAAAVIVEDPRGRVLVTQRSANLRTFPSAWVFPGGVVEPGEDFRAAALRELKEEVGLDMTSTDFDAASEGASTDWPGLDHLRLLGIFESCFPLEISVLPPKRHHSAMYFHLKLSRSIELRTLTLQPTEVSNAAWLTLPDPAFASKYLAERSPVSHFQPIPSLVELLHAMTPRHQLSIGASRTLMDSAPENGSSSCLEMDGMISEATYFFICELARQSAVQPLA